MHFLSPRRAPRASARSCSTLLLEVCAAPCPVPSCARRTWPRCGCRLMCSRTATRSTPSPRSLATKVSVSLELTCMGATTPRSAPKAKFRCRRRLFSDSSGTPTKGSPSSGGASHPPRRARRWWQRLNWALTFLWWTNLRGCLGSETAGREATSIPPPSSPPSLPR